MNSQQHPSVYEHRRPKSIEDTVKTDGKGIASGQKGPWDQCRDPGNCNPGPVQELGLPQDSWERAGLMSPSPAKQGLRCNETWLLEVAGRGTRMKCGKHT